MTCTRTAATRHLMLLAVALVTAAGCSPKVRSARFGDAPAPRPASQPVLLYSSKLPECPYDEVGLVRVEKRHGFTTMQAMLDALRERARSMGGDAVVGVGITHTVEGGAVAGTVTATDGLGGTVIRFTDDSCTRE